MKEIKKNQYYSRDVRQVRSVFLMNTTEFVYFIFIILTYYLFHLGEINYFTTFIFIHLYILRAFNLRHEKAHLPYRKSKGVTSWTTDLFTFPYSIYREPFYNVAKKHINHHRSHRLKGKKRLSTLEDPHQLLENKNFIKALFSCFFYDEIIFLVDLINDKGIGPRRLLLLIYSSLFSLIIISFSGLQNFFWFLLAYRINLTIAWFIFSYTLHAKTLYKEDLPRKIPNFIFIIAEILLGSGGATAVLCHVFHHTYPNKFIIFNFKTN